MLGLFNQTTNLYPDAFTVLAAPFWTGHDFIWTE